MAREAILRDTKPLVSRRYTCATGVGIPKGTFLTLGADQTASQALTRGQVFIGFAHADVNQSTDSSFNTETSVTADKGAIYELTASGSIVRGQKVKHEAPGNYVMACNATTDITSSLAIIIGVTLEEASNGEQVNVEVYP